MSSVTNFHFQPITDTFCLGLAMFWILLAMHANFVCICMKLITRLKLSLGLPNRDRASLGFVVNIFPGKRCPNFVAFGQDELKLYSE